MIALDDAFGTRFFRTVLATNLQDWLAAGWHEVRRSWSPSVGETVLLEWSGDGNPPKPWTMGEGGYP